MRKRKNVLNLHPPKAGTLAQLVEQRTENPCVPGSIPGGTTSKSPEDFFGAFLFLVVIGLLSIH